MLKDLDDEEILDQEVEDKAFVEAAKADFEKNYPTIEKKYLNRVFKKLTKTQKEVLYTLVLGYNKSQISRMTGVKRQHILRIIDFIRKKVHKARIRPPKP